MPCQSVITDMHHKQLLNSVFITNVWGNFPGFHQLYATLDALALYEGLIMLSCSQVSRHCLTSCYNLDRIIHHCQYSFSNPVTISKIFIVQWEDFLVAGDHLDKFRLPWRCQLHDLPPGLIWVEAFLPPWRNQSFELVSGLGPNMGVVSFGSSALWLQSLGSTLIYLR